ncbi:armadillo repeat-containing kinesin-like protein 1 isoform X1 [Solanum tuberosum]|uniref:armadillo repeat-containing kinesin-like protein 1 isoform X1 n=2 Tax=Solanum tuberosum TaxID=4113 RepID=UPI0003D25F59|nr:PREDICTED: armadillo repeat-containing kinesin-like protein 1 isoform X1 [Solanum tuberosum]
MATSSATTGRPSSSHRSERLPPNHGSNNHGSGRNGVANFSVNSQQQQQQSQNLRSKNVSSNSRRSVTPTSRNRSPPQENDPEPGRVRVAIRVRPRNAQELSDADYADCVELQPELKKLKLRKNNWNSEFYKFDEVFAESASQKRIYETVAKPVVESVLNGYNGTVMAYGQTGTGKTYTVGRLGKDDVSERGIMVRALEDIIVNTTPSSDSVEMSFLQLYMESIQDLLAPEKINIPIVEDAKTGEVSVPGATVVKIQDLDHFLQLLQIGEANRLAANTKLNTESSRSHAILMVNIRKSVKNDEETGSSLQEKDSKTDRHGNQMPIVRKSKLLIVDLAGSERIDKSGSEGRLLEEAKFINLSLTSLGKCINALAENSPHIPTRDSKLTRLLRDSFGGSARTSLIITVGPSSRHYSETTSTIMFGQRAMKIVNTVKLREEFDYENLCRKLETQVEHLTVEVDRQQKFRANDRMAMEKKLRECQKSFTEAERSIVARSEFLEKENSRLESDMENLLKELSRQKQLINSMKNDNLKLESDLKSNKLLEKENGRLKLELENVLKDFNQDKNHNNLLQDEVARLQMSLKHCKQQQTENSSYQKVLAENTQMYEKKITDLMKQLQDEHTRSESAEQQLELMKEQSTVLQELMEHHQKEASLYQKELADTTLMYEEKIAQLEQQLKDEHARVENAKEQLHAIEEQFTDHETSTKIQREKESDALRSKLEETHHLYEPTVKELQALKTEYQVLLSEKRELHDELHNVRQTLLIEEKQRKAAENELFNIKKLVPESEDGFEEKKSYMKQYTPSRSFNMHRSTESRERIFAHQNTMSKIIEEVGVQKIISLLSSVDLDVQIHAVKVVANLAAEDSNQEKIVQEGGLDALLMLLQSSQNATILRVASGAIANLAMNEMNQGLISSKGGAQLLANTAVKTEDAQTLRMVAGAIANLCGNEKLHATLREDGAVKALLEMARSGNIEVIAQVARGLANFAKCESRGTIQGHRKGRSTLMEDGVLRWLTTNSNSASSSTRRHIELALCHLAQNEGNARDFVSSGALDEIVRISNESSREDIRNLAKKTLKLSSTFQDQIRA